MRTLLLVPLCSLAVIGSGSACQVEIGRGWNSPGGGTGTIEVARNAGPCTGTLLSDPDMNRPADSITLTARPQHGRVEVEGGSFRYTPTPGYSGDDSFGLRASGPRDAGGRNELQGTIRVTVKP
jgi:hypothetical protein